MNNPYESSAIRRLKRDKRTLYVLVSPFLLPKWLLYCVSRFLERYAIRLKVEEFLYTLKKPLRAAVGFYESWAVSRSWKLLWIASPVLIMALIGFTVFYINSNRNRGTAYAGYYQGALQALQDQDYKQADLLFSRLIHHPSYKDDDEVSFRAMLAANANGNATRAKALRDKLLGERDYEPAKRWVAENAVRRGKVTQEEGVVLLAMARDMVESSPNPIYVEYWKEVLARILLSSGDAAGAVEVLEGEEKLEPKALLLLAQAYQAMGDKENSKRELRELVDYLERIDPKDDQFIREKVEGLATLAELSLDQNESRILLERALGIIEAKHLMAADRVAYDAWLGELRLRLFRSLVRINDSQSRIEAFQNLEKVILAKNPSYRLGETLNGVVDISSGYSLLTGQMMDVAVRSGGSGAHLALALDAWVGGNTNKARIHFKLANAIHPNAMVVARYAATYAASSSDPNKLDLNLFRGDNRSAYQRALDLLDLVAEVEPEQSISIVFDRCYIYSLRKSWDDIIEMIEPNLSQFEDKQLVMAYDWLMRANTQLGNNETAEEYQRAMQLAVRKARENEGR